MWPGQEHLQDLEMALENDTKEESALHKRAAAIQKAVDEVARMAPDAANAAQQMPGGEADVQVGVSNAPPALRNSLVYCCPTLVCS